MDALPAELIDLVVAQLRTTGEIEGPDQPSLSACCLVSSKFRHPCQKRLHKNLSLTSQSSGDSEDTAEEKTYTFAEALLHFQESPHLVAYVRHLWVVVAASDGTSTQQPTGTGRTWVQDGVVSAVFVQLTLVKTCCVRTDPGQWDCDWERVPQEVTTALSDWLSTTDALCSIQLSGIHNLPRRLVQSLFATTPSLSLNCIRVVPASGTEADQPDDTHSDITLRSVELWASSTAAEFIIHGLLRYVRNLRSLSLLGSFNVLPPLWAVAGHTLEKIHLEYRDSNNLLYTPASPLPKLRSLVIVLFRVGRSAARRAGSQIHAFIKAAPALTTVDIEVLLGWEDPGHQAQQCSCLLPAHMKEIDEPGAAHPALKALRISVLHTAMDSASRLTVDSHREPFLEAVNAAFPKALAKGRVKPDMRLAFREDSEWDD
ncbi:hypothetical protein HMN09_00930800 [Mycena chlorophos]|uniref:F-box domain-containing protein n=1 Tax=Mycena chlorophos TaxID=658473 RepID=A0A8H6W3L3_MYCCL|nr:hypothetical protein HMN09_00930800 [Mycena chlorophos]